MHAVQAQPECLPSIDQIAYCALASPSVASLGIVSQLQATPSGTPGLSGILMYEGRLMIHWLEGSPQHIEALWAQVENDSQQHCVVRLLHSGGHTKRVFNDWQMRATSRQDMMVVVREVKEQTHREDDGGSDGEGEGETLQWQHALSTLSILLDPDLTQFYAQAASPAKLDSKAAA